MFPDYLKEAAQFFRAIQGSCYISLCVYMLFCVFQCDELSIILLKTMLHFDFTFLSFLNAQMWSLV